MQTFICVDATLIEKKLAAKSTGKMKKNTRKLRGKSGNLTVSRNHAWHVYCRDIVQQNQENASSNLSRK